MGNYVKPVNMMPFKGMDALSPPPASLMLYNHAERVLKDNFNLRKGSIHLLRCMAEYERELNRPFPNSYLRFLACGNTIISRYKNTMKLIELGYLASTSVTYKGRASTRYSVTVAGLSLIDEFERLYKEAYKWMKGKQDEHEAYKKRYEATQKEVMKKRVEKELRSTGKRGGFNPKKGSEADKARIAAKLEALKNK